MEIGRIWLAAESLHRQECCSEDGARALLTSGVCILKNVALSLLDDTDSDGHLGSTAMERSKSGKPWCQTRPARCCRSTRLRRLHHIEASHLSGAIARDDGVYKQVEKPEPKCDANSTTILYASKNCDRTGAWMTVEHSMFTSRRQVPYRHSSSIVIATFTHSSKECAQNSFVRLLPLR